MKTLIDLAEQLKQWGEEFNQMAHGDFSCLAEGNWNDFYKDEGQLEKQQQGSVVL